MTWYLANHRDPVGRLYWSQKRGQWGSRRHATRFAGPRFPNGEAYPKCYMGPVWIESIRTERPVAVVAQNTSETTQQDSTGGLHSVALMLRSVRSAVA